MSSFFPVIYMIVDEKANKETNYNEHDFGIACDPEELPSGLAMKIIITNTTKDCLDAIRNAMRAINP